jgi:PAS domain S-box-containing protein
MNDACLRALFDSAGDATLVADACGIIVMANPAAAQLLGCGADQLAGTPVSRWMPAWHRAKSHADAHTLDDGAAMPIRRGVPSQVMCLRGDGQRFSVEVEHSRALVDGQSMYSLVVRKTAAHGHERAERLDSAALLIASMANESDAAFIADAEGRCVHFNEAFAAAHGFKSREECKRKMAGYATLFEIYSGNGELVPVDQRPLSRALRGEVGVSLEFRVRRQDTGDTWTAHYSFAPIRSRDDTVVGSVVKARRPQDPARTDAATHLSARRGGESHQRFAAAARL